MNEQTDINSRIYNLGYSQGADMMRLDFSILRMHGYSATDEENEANFEMGHKDGFGDQWLWSRQNP